MTRKRLLRLSALLVLAAQFPRNDFIQGPDVLLFAEDSTKNEARRLLDDQSSGYILGSDDQITVQAFELEEISNKPVRIDTSGYISLPIVGRIKASGLTVQQLEIEVVSRLKTYIREPQVSITMTEFHSQPVSVLGHVGIPGVHQLQGRKTLLEILSTVGGLKPEAGLNVKITRRREWGSIPVDGVQSDSTGQFHVAEVNLRDLMEAKRPELNIAIMPHDVITVPKAEVIYVVGEVRKAGGFALNDKRTISVLEAISLAEGLQAEAKPKNTRIFRLDKSTLRRVEIPVDLSKILQGKGTQEIMLEPEDILFVPKSSAKGILSRTIEAAVSAASQGIIWSAIRPY